TVGHPWHSGTSLAQGEHAWHSELPSDAAVEGGCGGGSRRRARAWSSAAHAGTLRFTPLPGSSGRAGPEPLLDSLQRRSERAVRLAPAATTRQACITVV